MVIAAAQTTRGTAVGVVDISLRGAYFSEPATLQMTVIVEPDEENRTLSIEADGEGMYTASEISLNGAKDKRRHEVIFKGLKAGHYLLRAQVRSSSGVRGTTTRDIQVFGAETAFRGSVRE